MIKKIKFMLNHWRAVMPESVSLNPNKSQQSLTVVSLRLFSAYAGTKLGEIMYIMNFC